MKSTEGFVHIVNIQNGATQPESSLWHQTSDVIWRKSSALNAGQYLPGNSLLLSSFKSLNLNPRQWVHFFGKQSPSRGGHSSWRPESMWNYISKWVKWSRSVVSDPQRPHGLQPSRLLHPWDFPGKSTGVGCHRLLWIRMLPTTNWSCLWDFKCGTVVKNLPDNAGDIGSIPKSGRSPGVGNGNTLQ